MMTKAPLNMRSCMFSPCLWWVDVMCYHRPLTACQCRMKGRAKGASAPPPPPPPPHSPQKMKTEWLNSCILRIGCDISEIASNFNYSVLVDVDRCHDAINFAPNMVVDLIFVHLYVCICPCFKSWICPCVHRRMPAHQLQSP